MFLIRVSMEMNCWTDGEVAVLEDGSLHWFLVLHRGKVL